MIDTTPGIAARFGLAYDRLAPEDEERSRWLAERCGLPDPDEVEVTGQAHCFGGLCACRCGRLVVIEQDRMGRKPKYATDECRRKVWDRYKPKDHRSYASGRRRST